MWLEAWLGTLNTIQIVILAWIASEQKASSNERKRRIREENGQE